MTVIRTREQPPRLVAPSGRPMARAPGAAGGGATLTARDVMRIVRKRVWLIVIALIVCLMVTAVATHLWRTYWPRYTTGAVVGMRPEDSLLSQWARTAMPPKDIMERWQRDQAQRVTTEGVLRKALAHPQVIDTTWYRTYHGSGKDLILLLQDDIDAAPIPNTSYIRIAMTWRDKDSVADIVNTVAEVFTDESKEKGQTDTRNQINKVQDNLKDMRDRLKRIREDRTRMIMNTPLAAMEAQRNTVAIKLQSLTQQVTEAEIAEAAATAAWQAYQQERQDGSIVNNPHVLMAMDMDPTLRGFVMQLAELRTRLDTVRRKFGPKHRSVTSLESLITSVEAQVELRRKEVITAQIESIGQIRRSNAAMAKQQAADLTERLNGVRAEARDLENNLGRIEGLRQEAEDVQDQTRRLETALLELQLKLGETGGQIGRAVLQVPAPIPMEKSPTWPVMMAVGALLGLVVGFGLAFLLELSDTSVKSPSDVLRRVDLPLLGMVPHAEDLDEDIDDFRRVALVAPHSPAAEAFRQIRTNLLFSGPAQHRRSILVTSPNPEDGRTTVVMNLAISIAQAGRRVLVVDANFRQPAIAGLFPDAAAAGLSSALVGQASWKDVVSASGVPNLDVITSGPQPPNPAELLGSDMMRQLIGEMTSEYDQVILDGSPVMVVSDACVLSTQVDGTILVVRAGSNSVGIVQRAAEQLSRVGAHTLGIVLQGVRSTAGGYLRKNYQTFYDYQQRILP